MVKKEYYFVASFTELTLSHTGVPFYLPEQESVMLIFQVYKYCTKDCLKNWRNKKIFLMIMSHEGTILDSNLNATP